MSQINYIVCGTEIHETTTEGFRHYLPEKIKIKEKDAKKTGPSSPVFFWFFFLALYPKMNRDIAQDRTLLVILLSSS